jgi:hypothetical protein
MSVKAILEQISQEHGSLSAELIVEQASDPNHPLHDKFEWDDDIAARLFRLEQASQMIRSVHINVQRGHDTGKTISVRKYVAVSEITDRVDARGEYLKVEDVINSDIYRTAWLQRLQREWQLLRRKAEGSAEFARYVLDDLRGDVG